MAFTANAKNLNYIDWDDYFMGVACLSAKRSKDPVTQVGACIVKDKIIVGTGYNGMPRGCNDDVFPWFKYEDDPMDLKYTYVCYAIENAYINKNVVDVKGATVYVTLFPSNNCAKIVLQAGMKEVIYLSDKNCNEPTTQAAAKMFTAAGVAYKKFEYKTNPIVIDFTEFEN